MSDLRSDLAFRFRSSDFSSLGGKIEEFESILAFLELELSGKCFVTVLRWMLPMCET